MSALLQSMKTTALRSRLPIKRAQLNSSFHSSSSRGTHFPNANAKVFASAIAPENSAGKVVLVDFYADWCHPCKMLSPILDKLTTDDTLKSTSGRSFDLVTVDTDSEDGFSLGQEYQVRAMPTVIAFEDGKVKNQFVGALSERAVRQFMEQI